MCKILISLAIAEPGDNWVNGGEYRWSKYDEPVPGWILPAPWTQPDTADGEWLLLHISFAWHPLLNSHPLLFL